MPTYTSVQDEVYFLEPGTYEAEVTAAREDISKKSGNPMIVLTVRVKCPDGSPGPSLREYLTFTEKAAFKIDQFRRSIGDTVTAGQPCTLEPEDCIGKTGWVELEEEPGSQNPEARFNKIARWLKPDQAAKAIAKAAKPTATTPAPTPIGKTKDENGDEIPF